MRTSETDPIRVDFISLSEMRLLGRIGLTFAPGKKQPGGMSGHWDRDLDQDLRRLRNEFGADVLVSLIEEHEFESLKIPNLRERAAYFGIESLWFSIPDQGVPSSLEEIAPVVRNIINALRAGRVVIIHCMGGLGRTGLLAACCLTATTDLTPEQAIAAVRHARPRGRKPGTGIVRRQVRRVL